MAEICSAAVRVNGNRPRQFTWRAVAASVKETADSSKAVQYQSRHCKYVEHGDERRAAALAKNPNCEHSEENAPVARHPAFGQAQDLDWILEVVAQVLHDPT